MSWYWAWMSAHLPLPCFLTPFFRALISCSRQVILGRRSLFTGPGCMMFARGGVRAGRTPGVPCV